MTNFSRIIQELGLVAEFEAAKQRFNTNDGLEKYLMGQILDDGKRYTDSSENPEAFFTIMDFLGNYCRFYDGNQALNSVLEDLSIVTADRFEPRLIVGPKSDDGFVSMRCTGVGLQLSLNIETTEVYDFDDIEDIIDPTRQIIKPAGTLMIYEDDEVVYTPEPETVEYTISEPSFPVDATADLESTPEQQLTKGGLSNDQ